MVYLLNIYLKIRVVRNLQNASARKLNNLPIYLFCNIFIKLSLTIIFNKLALTGNNT